MAVVAEEARIIMLLVDVVFEEVECMRDDLPVGQNGGDVVVDGHVRVFVHLLPHGSQVPTATVVVVEERKVERFGRGEHEEIPDARIVPHAPARCVGEKQAVVTPPANRRVHAGVLREDQMDPPVGVDPEDRAVAVHVRPIIHADVLALLHDRFVSPVEPDPRLHRVGNDEVLGTGTPRYEDQG